ncbi:PhzF family phenazine biosynthesis protein [Streptomyces brasiliensis]|uniref:PhzF family phenazine biosynthesis protein n=1 Tax=Streptomyces brasiliensis TaxID=1954 RepID=UPI00167079E7|nr:PhzF family phenazine biosynthesis protein [Streptomyces brasiliensis]
MPGRSLPVTIVHACLRDGGGGSPTAVLDDVPLTEAERRALPARLGTSHAVFAGADGTGSGRTRATLRFFTSAGELPACGHGTVAALAVLAERAGTERFEAELRAGGRAFIGRCTRRGERAEAVFDPGPVRLREPTAAETALVLPALGIPSDALGPGIRAASTGRWRWLVPVRSRAVLAGLSPDVGRLREACDRLGLLGCARPSATCEPALDQRCSCRRTRGPAAGPVWSPGVAGRPPRSAGPAGRVHGRRPLSRRPAPPSGRYRRPGSRSWPPPRPGPGRRRSAPAPDPHRLRWRTRRRSPRSDHLRPASGRPLRRSRVVRLSGVCVCCVPRKHPCISRPSRHGNPPHPYGAGHPGVQPPHGSMAASCPT